MIPLETLRTRYRVSRQTLTRWIATDGITTHPIPGEHRERAVRWGDIPPPGATRWRLPT